MSKVHIIVGGGTSGLLLAKGLIDSDHCVILIERGSLSIESSVESAPIKSESTQIRPSIELLWTYVANYMNKTIHVTNPNPNLDNRVLSYSQGDRIGGTSNINAMIWTAGCRHIYDKHWPNEWNSSVLEKSLQKIERVLDPTTVFASGNIQKLLAQTIHDEKRKINTSNHDLLIGDTYNSSLYWDEDAKKMEYFATCNHSHTERVPLMSILPHYITATPHELDQVNHRFIIIPNTSVSCIDFDESNRAIAVRVQTGEKKSIINSKNGGEIILCAGAFESPKILLMSGLQDNGSDDNRLPYLEGIGENFQDHVVLPFMFIGNWWTSKCHKPFNSVHGWINLDADGNEHHPSLSNTSPSAQLLFVDGRISAALLPEMLFPRYDSSVRSFYMRYFRPFAVSIMKYFCHLAFMQWICSCCFGILVCCTQPESKGRVRFVPTIQTDGQSTSGGQQMLLETNYLSVGSDQTILYNAMNTARNFVNQMRKDTSLHCMELLPGPLFQYTRSRSWFDSYCSLYSGSYYHGCGTCKMSPEDYSQSHGDDTRQFFSTSDGVVDEQLRVKGVSNLRVADASVIPKIPSGPIAAICMVIGDLAAKLITEKL